jgi:ADP-dependent NAD(P)H-hydrate dehydratase / NAD(P)H-hydrate epimerase
MAIKLVSVAEMQAVEREANASGLTYETMMENAGRGLAEVIAETYGYLEAEGICGLVGPGNNGGDTLVALAYLADEGWRTHAYLVRPRPQDDPLVERLRSKGGLIYSASDDQENTQLLNLCEENAILLDGLLGTGFRLPLKAEIAGILDVVRRFVIEAKSTPEVVAVDCPSGVDCDRGEASAETIPANLTVTMAAIKQGLLRFPANHLVGELTVVGIGLPDGENELPAWKAIHSIVPDAQWVRDRMPRRPTDAHKGTFGTVLAAAGSLNYTGAAWLAGQAAYRIGAGLVTLAVPEPLHAALSGQFPEATWLLLPEIDGFIDKDAAEIILTNLGRVTALLVGPGFGLNNSTGQFLERLLVGTPALQMGFINQARDTQGTDRKPLPPMVIDADGLKLLAKIPDWPKKLPPATILTPHPGEMSILCGKSTAEIQADRLNIARQFSQQWGHILILKGAFSVIAAPDGETAVIPVATPALARAGTGDVLTGLVAGLRAQGMEAFPAAACAAWIHAHAGWRAAEKFGNSASVMAGDLLDGVIQVISEELV